MATSAATRTGGQNAPTTPVNARSSTMPYGNFEHPFNLPGLAASYTALGDVYFRSGNFAKAIEQFPELIPKIFKSVVDRIRSWDQDRLFEMTEKGLSLEGATGISAL